MVNIYSAFALTLIAGMATGIGSIMALFSKRTNTKFLAGSLGFSAGVMVYVSMMEIFKKSIEYLTLSAGEIRGSCYAVAAFFCGVLLIGAVDWLIPSTENDIGNINTNTNKDKTLKRMGILTALAIGIHNFPEGMVTFTSALRDPQLGIAIAVAIAIHNIPEGIATSAPIYFSTGSRKKAFVISLFSGATEPVGAVIGYLIMRPFFNDTVFGVLFGIVAGIMMFISIEELLPMAREYDKSKITIMGFISGMFAIAVSLVLFMII